MTTDALGPRLGRPRWTWIAGGYLAALVVGWVYGVAIRAAGEWHEGAPWERSVLLTFDVDVPWAVDAFIYAVPWVGTNLTLGPAIGLAAAWLVWRRRADLAVWLATVEAGVLTLNWVMKHLLERERPELIERVGWFGWASYPSGHAMASLAVLTTVGLVLHRTTGRRWGIVLALVLWALVAASRLFHGVHWPTDIIGGSLVGLVWLVAAWFGFAGLPAVGRRPEPSGDPAGRPEGRPAGTPEGA